jgi:hypothetical protein
VENLIETGHGTSRIGPLGVDLDNTIVAYDDLFPRAAVDMGLIGPGIGKGKKGVRDAIRNLPDGETKWQMLQAEVYGPRMQEARPMEGAVEFFRECGERSVRVYIVSHKTEFASYDTTGTSLRAAAMHWLQDLGFFGPEGRGLSREQVFFESTRQAKIQRIANLGCSHFIDDLEETFLEDAFPDRVLKILFDPYCNYGPGSGSQIFNSWAEINKFFFP